MDKKEQAVTALKEVVDTEIGMNVIDGKMIFDLDVTNETISLKFRPTSPICPIALKLATEVKDKLISLNIFDKVTVEVIDHVMAPKINETLNLY